MSKQTVLYASIASLVLIVLGAILANAGSSVGTILSGLGGVAGLVSWIGGMIKTAQVRRWGWFVAVLLLGSLGGLIYGIAGPETAKI